MNKMALHEWQRDLCKKRLPPTCLDWQRSHYGSTRNGGKVDMIRDYWLRMKMKQLRWQHKVVSHQRTAGEVHCDWMRLDFWVRGAGSIGSTPSLKQGMPARPGAPSTPNNMHTFTLLWLPFISTESLKQLLISRLKYFRSKFDIQNTNINVSDSD